ncbi:hypothetical protein E2320_003084 [Naja naja]|nr:hypothetical protein E2320_003084 [Naja naja]
MSQLHYTYPYVPNRPTTGFIQPLCAPMYFLHSHLNILQDNSPPTAVLESQELLRLFMLLLRQVVEKGGELGQCHIIPGVVKTLDRRKKKLRTGTEDATMKRWTLYQNKLHRAPSLPKPSTQQGQTTGILFTGQKGLFAMALSLTFW